MKKFITLTSISLSIAFAIALANAEDTDRQASNSRKACTNENGVVFVPGDTGFKECVESAKNEQTDRESFESSMTSNQDDKQVDSAS